MKKDDIKKLLKLVGTKATGLRGDWVEAPCPFAPWTHDHGKDTHPSFGIKASTTKASTYKCFSCGMGGDLGDLLFDLSIHLKKQPRPGYDMRGAVQLIATELEGLEFDSEIPDYGAGKERGSFVEYPGWWLDSFPSAWKYGEALHYLSVRDVPTALIDRLSLRYDPMRKRLCFPFWNAQGKVAGIQGRTICDAEPRYFFYDHGGHKNTNVWLGEHSANFDKPLVLVEGPFDYASVYRVYQNVVASFSAGISATKMKAIAEAHEIITLFDSGKGGDQARKKVRSVLGRPVVDIVPISKDLDPGAMSMEMLTARLKPYVRLNQLTP